jgi:zinc protease
MTDPNYFKLYVGNHALGGHSFSSILMQEIRVKRGWSYGANSAFRFGLQPRSWLVHLFPAAKDTPDALAYTLKIMEDIKKDGISADRFEFAKKSLMNSSGFMYNTPSKRVENTLLEKTLNLPKGFMKSHAEQVAALNLNEVNQALKNFVKPENLTITVVGTAKNLRAPLAKAAGLTETMIEVEPYDLD